MSSDAGGIVRSGYMFNPWVRNPQGGNNLWLMQKLGDVRQRHILLMDYLGSGTTPDQLAHSDDKGWQLGFTDGSASFGKSQQAVNLASTLADYDNVTLTNILTAHVVSGKLDAAALSQQVMAGNGRATLATVSGDALVVTTSGSNVMVTDEKGGTAMVSITNVYQPNGVIHVVNKVLVPN